jgi:hypothetical protein
MGLFDSYFDPQQFGDSGGLLGRLLSLQQQQGQYQPGQIFAPAEGVTTNPSGGGYASTQPAAPQTGALGYGQTTSVPSTPDYWQTRNLAVGDYQMPQFGGADVSQATPQQLGVGDRLSAGLQSWAHTPVGNPAAALANGIAGFSSGRRADPDGIAQQNLEARLDALRPILGEQSAMIATANPDIGKTLIARALASRNELARQLRRRPNDR